MLPQVRPSSEVYGESSPLIFGGAIPVSGADATKQSALFGQTCFEPGEARRIHMEQAVSCL